jgi:hypothetical protein
MKIRAKADFYGSIKMDKDETREIENDPVISDLLKMGLIETLDEQEGGESDESERN